MIKAVVFDFFGVICSDQYWQYVKADRQSSGVFREFMNEVNTGGISWDDFVSKIAHATGTSKDEVKRLYATERIDPRMVDWITKLHGSYKTGLITNAHHEFIDPILEESHLRPFLDSVVVSSRIGVTKPNELMFTTLLEELGLEPHEAVFMDDLERYVDAAKELGLNAFHFATFEQGQEELRALGVDVG